MKSAQDKAHNNQGSAVAHNLAQGDNLQLLPDNRPEAMAQRRLTAIMNNSAQVKQMAAWKATMQAHGPSVQQFQKEPLPGVAQAVPKKQNHTGLPDHLKTGIENLSGVSVDDVRVHYNSVKPAQLQAHAYAQGTDIHIAPGQERHLPHEAWHTVQQKQGRVKPTLQLKSGAFVNDDTALEQEADTMGEKSNTPSPPYGQSPVAISITASAEAIAQRVVLNKDVLNVVGEDHDKSDARRPKEKLFCEAKTESTRYWEEYEFMDDSKEPLPADTPHLQVNFEVAVIRYHTEPMIKTDEKDASFAKFKGGILHSITEIVSLYTRYGEKDAELKKDNFVALLALVNEYKEKIETPQAKEAGQKFLNNTFKATPDEASTVRGMAMHTAAQAQYQKKGVWKIGDKHVKQIIDAKKIPTYNLIPRADFDDEYKDHERVIEVYKKAKAEKQKVQEEEERLKRKAHDEAGMLKMMELLRAGERDKKEGAPVSDEEKARKARMKKFLDDDDTPVAASAAAVSGALKDSESIPGPPPEPDTELETPPPLPTDEAIASVLAPGSVEQPSPNE